MCKHIRNNIKIYKWGARRDEHIQDKSLHEFGDRVIKMEERDTFLHFPTRDEVILSLEEVGFALIEGILRSDQDVAPFGRNFVYADTVKRNVD